MSKKLLIIALVVLSSIPLLFSSCSLADKGQGGHESERETNTVEIGGLQIGMSYDEALAVVESDNTWMFHDYMFTKDTTGTGLAVKFGNDPHVITAIQAVEPITPDAHSFEQIEQGMTVFEVVERVGIPTRSVTFGLCTVDYECPNGDIFRISWDNEMKVSYISPVELD